MVTLTICICTYQRGNQLSKLLDSIHCAIEKLSIPSVCVFVCVDGSTDGTVTILESYIKDYPCDLRYEWQDNAGLAAARNCCIDNSHTENIWFLDDDMLVTPESLSGHVNTILDSRTILIGECHILDSNNDLSPAKYYSERYNRLRRSNSITDPTDFSCANTSGKTTIFESVRFDAEITEYGFEDFDFAARALNMGINLLFSDQLRVTHDHNIDHMTVLKITRSMGKNRVYMHMKYPDWSIDKLPGIPLGGRYPKALQKTCYPAASPILWATAQIFMHTARLAPESINKRIWSYAITSAAYSGVAAANGKAIFNGKQK